MPEALTGQARAKVNLVLEVLGVRPDGYHEIDTILQELELADLIEIEPAEDWSIEVTGPRAEGTPADETNLALKAARLLAERVGGSPVRIKLEKHIPAAGGLGGGASDAATTLKLLAKLWPAVDARDLEQVAAVVGSDESFFLTGGTARAQGRGELVTPLPPLRPHEVVVFVPPQTIERKTARMFAELDRHAFDTGAVADAFVREPPASFSTPAVFNAFERVAFDLFPPLAKLWLDLELRLENAVRLAGAGPCLFWIGDYGTADEIGAAAVGAACDVILTRTAAR